MGLLGGGHCVAMCAAPCQALVQAPAPQVQPIVPASRMQAGWLRSLQLHAGRLLGYGALGALAGWSMEHLAWWSDRSGWLYPIWLLLHLGVLAWGLCMLVLGHQPQWLENAGRALWRLLQPWLGRRASLLVLGTLWAALPCGLLYSAVLVAALSGGAVTGALSMLAFGGGATLWLLAAPVAWRWLQGRVRHWRVQWGVRLSGLALVLMALWALWMHMVHVPAQWCR